VVELGRVRRGQRCGLPRSAQKLKYGWLALRSRALPSATDVHGASFASEPTDSADPFEAHPGTLDRRDDPAPDAGVTPASTTVEVATAATPELTAAIAALVPQLSSTAPPDVGALGRIIGHDAITLLLAYDDQRTLVGTLTLVTFPLPTGVRSWIEDVVVDEAARGQGVASMLVETANRIAEAQGARSVDLTSRPSREAANRLYLRLGFARRETNVYRYELE
jgi:ribosomal protein S18 acetylase RimI-like enzyme